MSVQLVRIINSQTRVRGLVANDGSILIDKIDKSQGNSENPPYAQNAKQQIYIPYANPFDPAVAGYTDLVQTDEVKLALEEGGSIGGLTQFIPPVASVAFVNSDLIQTPVVGGATNSGGSTFIGGSTFVSVSPDRTRVILTNLSGVQQIIEEANMTITDNLIEIADGVVTGTPTVGWGIQVIANSKESNSVLVGTAPIITTVVTDVFDEVTITGLNLGSATSVTLNDGSSDQVILAASFSSNTATSIVIALGDIAGDPITTWTAFATVSGEDSNVVNVTIDADDPVITGAANAASATTIDGDNFTTLVGVTTVLLDDTAGSTQEIAEGDFTSISTTEIVIPDGVVTIGTPTTGWEATVTANGEDSNTFTLT